MVFKVSKGGVRTGNTLRGLHSTRTKRYGRHACLVGHTSLGRRDLSRLLPDSSHDEQLVRDTMGKTDVLLSLNKQQRWRLPAIISRMIQQGDFNKGAVVSMLEKHKLKRKANCVSLVSNRLRNGNIAPKQKKYFTFSLDSFTEEQSKREKRRVRAAELQRMKTTKEKLPKPNTLYKTIETFTSDGTPKSNPIPIVDCDKPEYRLEVFYPCPQSCSLTYNPKYTDVVVSEGKTGEMEVKSNVKTPKKGVSTHRKRVPCQDIGGLDCRDIDHDVSLMWDQCYREDKDEGDTDQLSPQWSKESSIEMLLAQANKTRDLCIRKKESVHNRNKKKSKTLFSEVVEDKSHIVYIDREEKEEKPVPVEKHHEVESIPETVAPGLEYFRVVLKSSEIEPQELRRKYGSLYAEASCLPRRFIIDVTEDVSNILAWSKASRSYIDFSSYLVCVYDGFYDDGKEVYKVSFNSKTGNRMQGLSHNAPFAVTSISEVMNTVASHLLDLKEQNKLNFFERNHIDLGASNNNPEFVNSRLGSNVEVFHTSHELSRAFISDESENNVQREIEETNNALSTDLDEDLFCDVCYVSVTTTRIDSVPGTRLKQCGHLLCDGCWASHFRTGMRDGKTILSCGGYDCNITVGPVTLMSILNVSEVALLLQRQAEETLETMTNVKWCPHPDCGRVIKVKSKDLCLDVLCACGNKLCFSCLGPAHWPAKCEQAEEYFDKLPSLKPAKEYVEEQDKPIKVNEPPKKKQPKAMMVEGRLCPRCDRFIEKNGGCPHMVCKCGFSMCWTCMKPYGHAPCKPDISYVLNRTRMLVVRHASRKTLSPQSEDIDQHTKIEKNKQKASMCQKALQQREENSGNSYMKSHTNALVTKMVKTAKQDALFKMEILTAFSVNIPPEESSQERVDVTRYVDKLIDACLGMKKELHHVIEFTFILLQDTPHSVDKQRILKVANDLSGFCSFVRSILDLGDKQDPKAAFRRLVDLQEWAKRALDALIRDTNKLRAQ